MVVFLIGFMGSGKTYLGKSAAKLLQYNFIDFDEYIEQHTHQTIPEIFERKGEVYFRQVESHLLEKMKLKNNTIISLGGGTPCFNDNMSWIKENGRSIYLKVSVPVLYNRLIINKTARPLLRNISDENLSDYITFKLKEREVYYNQATKTINADMMTGEELKRVYKTD